MWIAQKLVSSAEDAVFAGPVEIDEKGDLYLNDGGPVPLSGMLAPYGYLSLPAVGCTGRAVSDGQGGYFLAGVIGDAGELEPGEIRISSSGGAYILLKNSGEVVINGLVIGADGRIASE